MNVTLPLQVVTTGWTLGEIEIIEDIMEKPIGAIQGATPKTMSIKQIIAIAFVSARREDPEVTVDEIRQLDPDKDINYESNDDEDDEVNLGPLEESVAD